MEFSPFPFDQHTCKLEIMAAASPHTHVNLTGHTEKLNDGENENTIQYDIEYSELTKEERVKTIAGMSQSVVGVRVHMAR